MEKLNNFSFGVDIFTLRRYQDTYLYQFNTDLNRRHYYANIDTCGQTPIKHGLQSPSQNLFTHTHRIHGAGIYANMTGVY